MWKRFMGEILQIRAFRRKYSWKMPALSAQTASRAEVAWSGMSFPTFLTVIGDAYLRSSRFSPFQSLTIVA